MRISSFDKQSAISSIMTPITSAKAALPDYWVGDFPDLTHTRLRSGRVAGRAIHRPSWAQLQRVMVDRFLTECSAEELYRLGLRDVVFGKVERYDYMYNKAKNVSVRLCSANRAAQNVAKMAQALGIQLHLSYIHPRDRSYAEKLIIS